VPEEPTLHPTDRPGAPAAPPDGDVPGHELLGRLGRGGSSAVYLARQAALGRTVAVKVLSSPALDPAAVSRFERECRAVGSLSWHPHVVTVHDTGSTRLGQPFLTMEHHPAGSVQDRLDSVGPLSWDEVTTLGRQVADALDAAHAAGILHRDVKPANVLIDRHGRYLLADFGIARLVDHAHTTSGVVTATVSFAAPEVLAGGPATPRSDLYSLGLTMYAAVSGHHPFLQPGAETPLLDMLRVDGRPPPPLAGPAGVVALVERLLARDPAARPQSAAEVREDLDALASGAPVALPPRGAPPTAGRRWPLVAAALGAALVVGALVAGLVAWDRGGDGRAGGPATTVDRTTFPLGTLPTDPDLAKALLPDVVVDGEVGVIDRAYGGGRLFAGVRADVTAPCDGHAVTAEGLTAEAVRAWDGGDGFTTLQSVGQQVTRFSGVERARRFVDGVRRAATACGFTGGPVDAGFEGADQAVALTYDAPADAPVAGGPTDSAWVLSRQDDVVVLVVVAGDIADQAAHARVLAAVTVGLLP